MKTTSVNTDARETERRMRVAISQDIDIKIELNSDMIPKQDNSIKRMIETRKRIALSYRYPK